MIVLDASAVVELLLGTAEGAAVARRIDDPSIGLHAPHLLDVEVVQVVRRYVLAGQIGAERGKLAVDLLMALDLTRHDHDILLPRIWELRANLTAYDAAYVALAEALEAPLITFDGRIASAPGHRARIELF